jgi:Tol biopolymer transport system component
MDMRLGELPNTHEYMPTAMRSVQRSVTKKPLIAFFVHLLGLSMLTGCTSVGQLPGIYTVAVDDGTTTWVGQPPGMPAWSPIGETLVWGSEDGLVVNDLNNGSSHVLSGSPVAGRPAWAPNGDAIAFFDDSQRSLAIVDAASGNARVRIPVATEDRWSATTDLMSLGGPAWSRDGSRIAFACWDGAGDELCVVDSDGGGRQQVTRLGPTSNTVTDPGRIATATSNIGPPAWAPNDDAIAVTAYPERSGAPSGLFVVDLDRGTARQVSKLVPNSEISWAPDGDTLIFSATEKGRSDVVRVSVKDGTATKLTSQLPAGARSPALSPDGTRVAAISQGALVILGEDGTVSTASTHGLKDAFPAWDASGKLVAVSAREDPISRYD